MFDTPIIVRMASQVEKWNIGATGFATTHSLAAMKARSELIERIYATDLMQEDTTGIFTYRTPTYWCSTGTAAHPDRDQCLENSLAEIIERDMVSCWFAISRTYSSITNINTRELVEIPCMYKGWHVVVSIRRENDCTAIQAAASRNLEDAMLKAFYESHLRTTLPDTFKSSRLPELKEGKIKHGDLAEPELFLREWKYEDLFLLKQYSHQCGDMRRGVPALKAAAYKKFIGEPECIQIPISFSWCH
jgi:hypothetical protein